MTSIDDVLNYLDSVSGGIPYDVYSNLHDQVGKLGEGYESAWDLKPEDLNNQTDIEYVLWMHTNPGQFGRRGMPHPGFRTFLEEYVRAAQEKAFDMGLDVGDRWGNWSEMDGLKWTEPDRTNPFGVKS